jgi:hypothetical protein
MVNHEMYRVVYVDIPLKSYSKMIDRYTELKMAMSLIESIRHVQIIFVVSNNLANEALIQLKSHRHVRDVFILNNSSECLKIDVNQHESLVGIFNNENELNDAIQTKIVSIEKQVLPFSVFDQTQRTSKDLSNEFNSFLWYQVLFHTLKQMPADEQAKEDMLQICSNYYQDNHREELIIQQYRESSNEDQAIHW